MDKNQFDVLVIGGGAAGFFTAINAAENNPKLRIAILERSNKVLAKVKISGGGRCNVTHAEFDPMELVRNYPRGKKELLGPFHKFMTGDIMAWFEERGVGLKIEEDGRVFPVSNDSQTIIDCFLDEIKRNGVTLLKKQSVMNLQKVEILWKVHTKTDAFFAPKVLIASGSNNKMWNLLENFGHTIVPPVPSLFTFNIQDHRISDLPGVATNGVVCIIDKEGNRVLESQGPLLITHWGMSGPAILKLSAWGARLLARMNYQFTIEVNWIADHPVEEAIQVMKSKKLMNGKKRVVKDVLFDLPRRLWNNLVEASDITSTDNWGDLSKKQYQKLAIELTRGRYLVEGKSTFKEEFVTAGGVKLSEIDFGTFESKIHSGLYFAGEVLDIDAITGGFNFQSAWTGGFLAAKAISDT